MAAKGGWIERLIRSLFPWARGTGDSRRRTSTSPESSPVSQSANGSEVASKFGAALGAVLVAVVSGLIGAFVGAGLETVRTANSEALELTKRSIDRSSEVYDRLNSAYHEWRHTKQVVSSAIFKWEMATSAQEETETAKQSVEIINNLNKEMPDHDSYDVWVQPSLRDALDAFASAISTEQIISAMRWECTFRKWNQAITLNSPLYGSLERPGVQEKFEIARKCGEIAATDIATIPEAREQFQRALDAFVNAATTPPGLWDLIIGAKPKPPPLPAPRKSVQELERIVEAARDAGPRRPIQVPDAAARAAEIAAENEALVRELGGEPSDASDQ